MAVTTPRPDDILKDKEVIDSNYKAPGIPAKGQTSYMPGRPEYNTGKGTATQVPARALEKRQAGSFARLAEDTWIEAYRKYAENPTTQTKAAADAAKADFVKATSNYKNITGNVYETNKVDQKYVGTLPKEPKGFDPKQNYNGAQTPGDRAKIDNAPDYIPPNYLNNGKWNSNDFSNVTGDSANSIYIAKGSNYKEQTPIAFIANENGSIYQNTFGDPVELDGYVNQVIAEYSNAGKMNDLRLLLIKVTQSEGERAGLNSAKNMAGAGFVGTDFYTRELVKRAVQGATIANIFVTGEKNKGKFLTLSGFLNSDLVGSNSGFLKNYFKDSSGGGSGAPRKTVSLTRNVYTPEDLELNIDAFFQEYTGQGATKEDVEYLTKRLNKLDPQKTVTTNNGNTSTSVTTGGVSSMEEQNMMREMALKDPNAEGYNKATAYLSYFEKALKAPIELGA